MVIMRRALTKHLQLVDPWITPIRQGGQDRR
jgi:hypothetical protein